MASLHEWMRRLWGTLRRNPNDRQLDEEIRLHLELAAEDLQRRGRSPEDSLRTARLQAGGVAQAMEAMRDQRGLPWLENLARDGRHGLRVLRRSPGFTAVALLTIALGIGANTAIFSLINAVLLRPLPFADPERLVIVWEDSTFVGFPHNTPAAANYADIKAQSRTLEDLAALDWRSFNLTGDGEPERVEANGVTANLLPLLGIRPALGRSFTAEEDSPEGPKVMMLSYGLWQSRYGGVRNIIGRDLLLNNEKYTVIGVLPPGFEFLRKDIGIFVPIAFTRELLNNRGRHYLTLAGRMKQGVTLAESQADAQAIMRRIGQEHPRETFNGRLGAVVVPLREQLAGEVRRPLAVLLVAVGFVLLIACANVANLLLARATKRRTEAAVRTALGAGYARTIAQALTESMLLAVAGSGIGLIFARWSFAFLKRVVPEGMAASTNLELDWRILGFTLLAALLTGLIFGLAPAFQIARVNLNEVLKQSGGRADLRSGSRFRSALVIAEVALAMLLLVGAGLLIQTFFNLRGQYSGLRTQHVLTVRTQLPETRYRELPRRVEFYDQVLEHVKSLPGVVSAGYTTSVPLGWKGGTTSFIPEGRQPEPGVVYDANYRQISENYFETIGIELLKGRRFVNNDDAQSIRVAIINQTMARQFWPGTEALGKRFKPGGPDSPLPWTTIVGIVADVRQMGADAPVKAEMYFPYRQIAGGTAFMPRDLVIRTSVEPAGLAAAIRREIYAIDPNQPISDIRTMDDILSEETAARELGMLLLTTFAGLALLLSTLGIYGVLSYFVAQHTHDIGLQVALGARAANILALILKKGMLLAVAGVGIGLMASFALTRLMRSLLYEVGANDPMTFAGVAALLLAVAFLACYIPARRAMRVDPIVALRYE
jgi:putative ABC transport system permease protein